MNLSKYYLLLFGVLLSSALFAQSPVWIENKGQWEENVLFRLDGPQGRLYLEKDGITFQIFSTSFLSTFNHQGHSDDHKIPTSSEWLAVGKINYIGANFSHFEIEKGGEGYHNYYLGSDPSKWTHHCRKALKIRFINVYPNIDFILEEHNGNIKYSWDLKTGSNLSDIRWTYEGMQDLYLDEAIHFQLLNVHIKETAPVLLNRREKVTFIETEGVFHYSTTASIPFIIDPDIVFSTFAGSTSDNWGYTATFDNEGNTYGGGIAFGSGYPTTPGVYDNTYNGGSGSIQLPGVDISISKFNEDGSQLLYSTYIGGSGNESPHSIICDNNNALYVLGTTSSTNFPTQNPYQAVHNGGDWSNIPGLPSNPITYSPGADMVIFKLSPDASFLEASTFYGGSGNDGLNRSPGLAYNYGDTYRGEINISPDGNILIASTTNSNNISLVNPFDNNFSGTSEGIIAQFTPDLNSIMWSSYIGGSDVDALYSLDFDNNGNVFTTGGSKSVDIVMTGLQTTLNGLTDGILYKIDPNGNFLNGTYFGTSEYDQGYFVRVDLNNNPLIYGQSEGSYPRTPGTYGQNNSGQILHLFSGDLSSTIYSTTFGSGSGHIDISPTALSVTDCGYIYLSGWGSDVNNDYGIPNNSQTFNLPVTPDAYQINSTGHDFYFMVLEENATGLNYGTFIGGTADSHVDGGTSRFDKEGNIYQATCAACQTGSFPTTPGVWSENDPSNNCNMAVVKFNLRPVVSVASTPETFVCMPDAEAFFTNGSVGATNYLWDFGDGNTSTAQNPSHTYTSTGNYIISLVAWDSTLCLEPDTTLLTLDVLEIGGTQVFGFVDTTCANKVLNVSSNTWDSYQWLPSGLFNNPNGQNTSFSTPKDTVIYFIGTNVCGSDTLSIPVITEKVFYDFDTVICAGDVLSITGPSNQNVYNWLPGNRFTPNNQRVVNFTGTSNTIYSLNTTSQRGCNYSFQGTIEVDTTRPIIILADTLSICKFSSTTIEAEGAREYIWDITPTLSALDSGKALVTPINGQTFYVTGSNACGSTRDSIHVQLIEVYADISPNIWVCEGDEVMFSASGGDDYVWIPGYLSPQGSDTVTGVFTTTTVVTVVVYDSIGCYDTATSIVNVNPLPDIEVYSEPFEFYGLEHEFIAVTNGSQFYWDSNLGSTCNTCLNSSAVLYEDTYITATAISDSGCIAKDSVLVQILELIYVPNTFTPNGIGPNELFKAVGSFIYGFEFEVYDRWGKRVYYSEDINEGWDGTVNGLKAKEGAYVWKIRYHGAEYEWKEIQGHVILLR